MLELKNITLEVGHMDYCDHIKHFAVLNDRGQRVGEVQLYEVWDKGRTHEDYNTTYAYMDQLDNSLQYDKFSLLVDIGYGAEFPLSNILVLEKLIIEENYRGMGIGTEVLEIIKSMAIEKNMDYVMVYPCPISNLNSRPIEEIRHFYMKSGFEVINTTHNMQVKNPNFMLVCNKDLEVLPYVVKR